MKIISLLFLVSLLWSCQRKSLPSTGISTCCSKPAPRDDLLFTAPNLHAYVQQDSTIAPALKQHLSNRYELTQWDDVLRTQESVIFRDQQTRLSLQTSTAIPKYYYTIGFESYADFGGEDSVVQSLNGKPVFGWRYNYKQKPWQEILQPVTRISHISLNGQPIDVTPLEHLLFPSLQQRCFSLHPVQAYWSPDKAYIYLYIFGKADPLKQSFIHDALRKSYMAKVIINVHDKTIEGVIPVAGWVLYNYQWFCEGFIGF